MKVVMLLLILLLVSACNESPVQNDEPDEQINYTYSLT